MSPSRLLLPLLLFAPCACDDDASGESLPPECAEITEDPRVTIGTGEEPTRHTPVADGDELLIEPGLQGGHHIWGSFRFVGLLPDDLNLVFSLHEGELQVGGSDYIDDVRVAPSGEFEYGGVTVFIYNDVGPQALDGETLTMRVTLHDQCGRSATDEVSIRARCCAQDP